MINKYKTKSGWAFLLGLIVGIVFFVVVYGVDIINPTNVEWLLHSDDLEGSIDLTQHYMGWVFYKDTPWHFPIGLTEGIYSEPVSVVYTDSIPLFALIFKIISGILPEAFQYMGIYGLMCYALMGGFGALITRRYSSNAMVNVVSASFFVLSPVMLNRMYLHTALSAHFLIIAGIVLWLYRSRMKRSRYVWAWTGLIVGGTLINAYFTPILLGILLCSILQDLICGERIKNCIMLLLLPLATTLVGGWIMGMFYGETNASGSGGLDKLSFNLDGFFNPMTYATDFGHFTHDFREISYSSIIRNFPLTTPYQNEGFSYLGLGMIALTIMSVILLVVHVIRVNVVRKRSLKKKVRAASGNDIEVILDKPMWKERREQYVPKSTKRKYISYVISLAVYLIVFTFLALSPTWTLGHNELFSIPWPELIWKLLSTFRSTGRFIWPVYYMIMTLALLVPTWIFVKNRPDTYVNELFYKYNKIAVEKIVVIIIMLLCLVAQIIDLSSAIRQKHVDFTKNVDYESDLQSPIWDSIAENCDTIVVYPPSQDLYWDGISALTFEIFAKENDMSLNMTYMSRDLTEYADEKTKAEFQDIANGTTYPNHVYVFLSAKEDELPDADKYHLNYYKADGYIIAVDKEVEIKQ